MIFSRYQEVQKLSHKIRLYIDSFGTGALLDNFEHDLTTSRFSQQMFCD